MTRDSQLMMAVSCDKYRQQFRTSGEGQKSQY